LRGDFNARAKATPIPDKNVILFLTKMVTTHLSAAV
jgi:hypothetical protein